MCAWVCVWGEREDPRKIFAPGPITFMLCCCLHICGTQMFCLTYVCSGAKHVLLMYPVLHLNFQRKSFLHTTSHGWILPGESQSLCSLTSCASLLTGWVGMTNGENSLCLWSHGSVLILRSDAAAEHAVPAETPGAAAGPPGSQCDDHGLHLAGRRGQQSWGISVSSRFIYYRVFSNISCFTIFEWMTFNL